MSELYFSISLDKSNDENWIIGFTPIGDIKIPKKYYSFKAEIEKITLTLNLVYKKNTPVKSQYIEDLFNACKLCFSDKEHDFELALSSLTELKDSFLTVSWSKVRDKILIQYGIASLILSLVFVISYFFISDGYQFIVYVLVGSFIGSWLSLAIKTNELTFDQIVSISSEISMPRLRGIFISLLTLTAIFFLKSGVLTFNIGNFSSENISHSIDHAFVLGIILGFSEQYLIGTIKNKSKKALK